MISIQKTIEKMARAKLQSALEMTRKNQGFAFLSYAHGFIDGLRAAGSIDANQAGRLNDLAFNAHQHAQRDAQ
tara:strand:- start:442 stop:660 length:219 start_codon:yes stop_codon:yes gene_type:complete